MSRLSKILRHIVASFFGLIVFAGLSLIGVLIIYTSDNDNDFGILISFVLGILGLYLGYKIYTVILRRGILEFLTAIHATPTLDNLPLTDQTDIKQLSAQEFAEKFSNNKNIFTEGIIRIWGDWEGRDLESINELSRVEYEMSEDILKIVFLNNNRLTIWGPDKVFESESYLKINEAEKIKWEWLSNIEKNSYNYFLYEIEGKKVRIKTNTNWNRNKYDTILGQPALFMASPGK